MSLRTSIWAQRSSVTRSERFSGCPNVWNIEERVMLNIVRSVLLGLRGLFTVLA